MPKLSPLARAVAVTCGALGCASAFALPASSYTNTGEFVGTTENIRISGASAQDNGILGSALTLCTPGSVHRYAISNNFVFFCTPDIGTGAGQIQVRTGSPAVSQLAIYKYSVGGSAFGVTAINSTNAVNGSALGADGNLLPFLDLTKIAASCTGTNLSSAVATFNSTLGTYVDNSCANGSAALTTLATTYIGVSDVEPAFFSNNIANITPRSSYALIFGVPVTLNIRNALQSAQGLTVGSDTEANMPSLSSAQVTSLYTQPGQSWAGVGITSGLGDDTVYVAKRVNSSGTQKTFEAVIAHTPNGEPANKSCSTGTDPFVPADSGLENTSGGDGNGTAYCTAPNGLVFAGSGGGDVRNCLAAHQANGRGAIGILTTEDVPPTGTGASGGWRFVKVNGFAPNQAKSAAGTYPFWVESSLNKRTSGAAATDSAPGYTAFFNRLASDFANTTIVNSLNKAQTFGVGGVMALRSRVSPMPAPDYTGASGVMPWSRLVGGATSDNCQAPKAIF